MYFMECIIYYIRKVDWGHKGNDYIPEKKIKGKKEEEKKLW